MILVHFLRLCFVRFPPLDYATFFYHLVQKSSKSTKASSQLLSSVCVDMTWSAKGFEGLSFFIIRSFYVGVVIAREFFLRLGVF
jgi:hypothetical protein